jgi:MSHA biogenesis protein MshP
MSITCPKRRAGGFAIVSAIFILVVLAALAGFIVSVTTTQNLTFAQDIQGSRAYQAARAGTEWELARWLGDTPSNTANCPNTLTGATLTGSLSALDGFDVEIRTELSSSDGGINFCTVVATASSGTVGSIGFIERQIRVVVEGNPP